MGKLFNKAKKTVGDIHWPRVKEVVSDTLFTVSVTTILSLMISVWTGAIERIVNFVISFF